MAMLWADDEGCEGAGSCGNERGGTYHVIHCGGVRKQTNIVCDESGANQHYSVSADDPVGIDETCGTVWMGRGTYFVSLW